MFKRNKCHLCKFNNLVKFSLRAVPVPLAYLPKTVLISSKRRQTCINSSTSMGYVLKMGQQCECLTLQQIH